jgi:hypothetical protein
MSLHYNYKEQKNVTKIKKKEQKEGEKTKTKTFLHFPVFFNHVLDHNRDVSKMSLGVYLA